MRFTGCIALSLAVPFVFGVLDKGIAADAPTQPQATETVSIGWVASYEQARDEAQRLGKPLLIHFHATWCGPCRSMEAGVLNTEPVVEQLKTRVVGVKIDSGQRPDLISRFGIGGLPADVFVAPDGQVLARDGATYSPEDYRRRILLVANRYHGSRLTDIVAALKQAELDQARIGETADMALAVIQAGVVESDESAGDPSVTTAAARIAAEDRPVEAIKPAEKSVSSFTPGMKGYSPVAILSQQRWLRGDRKFMHLHKGIEYYLSSPEELETFKADADRYAPAWAGLDPLELTLKGEAKPGSVRHAAYFQNRLYLFASEENRQKFVERPADFEHALEAAN